MPLRFLLLSVLLFCGTGPAPALAETVVKVISRGDTNADYAIRMLDLALQKSGASYRIDVENDMWSAARLRFGLTEGTVDVIWSATTSEMEAEAIPVRVPLYKGLLGFRLLMVHKDDFNMFAHVDDYNDLKQYRFGQGRGWPDTEILLANNLQVEQVTKYEGIFHMLDGQRFDAFPRGAHEPWSEIQAYPDLELAVEPHLLFVYKSPYYLFVNPAKPELARLIEQGFEAAITDGSFDQVFWNDPTVKMVVEKANIKDRKAFSLTNPGLPATTPLHDERLWFDPQQDQGAGI